MSKCQEIARQFLSAWFQPEETFALLARYPQAPRTLQRIVRLSDLVKSNYLGWLAFENSRGANIYFSINPLSSGAKKRTKSADHCGEGTLSRFGFGWRPTTSSSVRIECRTVTDCCYPHFDGETSGHLARQGIHDSRAGSDAEGLAETFGGDRACTDCARVFRLPGFFNRKYSPAFPVTLEMRAIQLEYSPSDFRLDLATVADVQPHHIDRPRSLGSRTRSESDWRWVMAQLNAGIPAQEIVQTLANIRSDKPNPHYYAHRTVDMATAVQWVRKGVDFESVIEGLKARNSALSTDRAAEIATTAFRFVQRVRILHSKEN